MTNRGFTLIELLAVIVLLIIISMLIVPSVINIIDHSEGVIYNKQVLSILNGAYDLTLKDTSLLPTGKQKNYITLEQLKHDGLVDNNIINPETKQAFPNDLVISISYVSNSSENSDPYAKKSGSYLYKIEYEFMQSNNYDNNRPTIVLLGLTPNSDGNYIVNVEINSEYTPTTYTAKSHKNVDITSNVFASITYNDTFVDNIDTSKIGIYRVDYVVVDSEGYSNIVTKNVIVKDTTPPTISFVDNQAICEDNSGKCTVVESSDVVETSTEYVITYIAKDPSGNTSTARRVVQK